MSFTTLKFFDWPKELTDAEWKKAKSLFTTNTGVGGKLRDASAAYKNVDWDYLKKFNNRQWVITDPEDEKRLLAAQKAAIIALTSALADIVRLVTDTAKKQKSKSKPAQYLETAYKAAYARCETSSTLYESAAENLRVLIAEFEQKKEAVRAKLADAQAGRDEALRLLRAFDKRSSAFLDSIRKSKIPAATLLPALKLEIAKLKKEKDENEKKIYATGTRGEKVNEDDVMPFNDPKLVAALNRYKAFSENMTLAAKINQTMREIDAHYLTLESSVKKSDVKLLVAYQKALALYNDVNNTALAAPIPADATLKFASTRLTEQEKALVKLEKAFQTIIKIRQNLVAAEIFDRNTLKVLDAKKDEFENHLRQFRQGVANNRTAFPKA